MNVLVFAPYPPDCSPGQRFRFEQWVPLLPDTGMSFDVRAVFSKAAYRTIYSPGHAPRKAVYTAAGLLRRALDVPACRRADVVLLYRFMFPLGPPLLDLLVERRVPVVYDFDDAIFLRTTNPHNRVASLFKQSNKISSIIASAAHTTVGNEYLARYARKFSPNVSILPTTLDTVRYSRPNDWQRTPGRLRIGWSGSTTTTSHLRSIDRALQRVLSKHDVELVVIGAASYQLPGNPKVVSKSWDPATEISDICDFDIGIMPLPDDEFARGKCGFKALLYMALSVPCVVSPVGVNTAIVRDDDNGLLATTEDEWVAALGRMIEDEGLRRRLAAAGRQTVVRDYDGRSVAPHFAAILSRAVSSSSKASG